MIDEKYAYERMPKEPAKSFNLYLVYRDLGVNRTYRKVLGATEREITFQQVRQAGSKWSWVERANAYDRLEYEAIQKKRENAYWIISEHEINTVKGLFQLGNTFLNEVINSNKPLEEKVALYNKLTSTMTQNHDYLCNITGKPKEYKHLDVKANVKNATRNLFEQMNKNKK